LCTTENICTSKTTLLTGIGVSVTGVSA